MQIRRDKLGIPVLDAADIERLAEHFLGVLIPEVTARPMFTPVAEIMSEISARELCTFSFDEDLGFTPEGYKYLGYYPSAEAHRH